MAASSSGCRTRDYCKLRGNRISMIFQEPMTALNPMHTIGHQVAEPLRRHKDCSAAQARERRSPCSTASALPDAAQGASMPIRTSSPAASASASRIAMALACEPDLLIADEPTTALDVTIQGQILDLIADLVAERGMSMILISHDLGVIARERAAHDGDVWRHAWSRAGRPTTVFRRMGASLHAGPVRARPRSARARGRGSTTIAGTVPELADLPAGCAFADRCPLVEDRCRAALPPMVEVGPGHRVRCVRTDVSMADEGRSAARMTAAPLAATSKNLEQRYTLPRESLFRPPRRRCARSTASASQVDAGQEPRHRRRIRLRQVDLRAAW